jgi:heat shock protein HtpX
LAHIKHRHVLVATVAATLAGAVMMLATWARWGLLFFGGGRSRDDNFLGVLAMSIVAPLAAVIVQTAISRQNEFQADRTGAEIAGTPRGLSSALRRLDAHARQIPMEVNPAAAQLAIVNPLSGWRGLGLMKLLSTHPPMEERVARLEGR